MHWEPRHNTPLSRLTGPNTKRVEHVRGSTSPGAAVIHTGDRLGTTCAQTTVLTGNGQRRDRDAPDTRFLEDCLHCFSQGRWGPIAP